MGSPTQSAKMLDSLTGGAPAKRRFLRGQLPWGIRHNVCHKSVLPEEWESFLRTGKVAAEPQAGYGSTEWIPGWEPSSGENIDDK